ncbi:MAG: ATP-binding protein [Pseudomonadota bacterium]
MAGQGGIARKRRTRVAFSRLTLTIVLANLISLAILFIASFTLTQHRDGLIGAKLQGVRAQAQIIADVLAQVAIDETSCQPVDEADIARGGEEPTLCALALNQTDVREVFNRVWDSFEGRVRIFAAPQTFDDPPVSDAAVLLIEDVVLREDHIIAEDLPNLNGGFAGSWLSGQRLWETVLDFFSRDFHERAARRTIEAELNQALASSPFASERGATSVRIDEEGELVASVTVPIRRVQAIYGLVTAEIGGIDELVEEAKLAILPFFGLAVIAAVLSSLLLTAAIAQPIRQLAIAADKVREGIAAAGRARIPDFTGRRDEIGELSGSLKSMTQAIYARIDAIESFAADVAHELKNPLTSIRSAAETLVLAKTPEQQEKLLAVISKDVARMDRLITDISNASRLDAELARETREAVDLRQLIGDITRVYGTTGADAAPVQFRDPGQAIYVLGNATALGQVIRNLIDNARSFTPATGRVRVSLDGPTQRAAIARITVDDNGPGLPPDSLEKIFDRFYTKRPAGAAFGNNSGLGLAISRQIANAHGGRIYAKNRVRRDDAGKEEITGARFVVELPAE